MLQETPSELENQIGVARRAVTGVYLKAHQEVQGVVSKWIGVEQAVERASLGLHLSFVINLGIFAIFRSGEEHPRPGRTSHAGFTLYWRFSSHWIDPRAEQVDIHAIRASPNPPTSFL